MIGRMKNQIKAYRNQKDWTQQELADRVEVSRQTIISLERGHYNPSILLAFPLARQFADNHRVGYFLVAVMVLPFGVYVVSLVMDLGKR